MRYQLRLLAAALGLLPSPESITLQQLLALYDPQRIPRDAIALPEGF
jgi:hypothetical protein